MFERIVTLSDVADAYLQYYLMRNTIKGIILREIFEQAELISAIIFEALFVQLPKGMVECGPHYVSIDREREGASVYTFKHGFVSGTYSACPERVHVLTLEIDDPLPASAMSVAA